MVTSVFEAANGTVTSTRQQHNPPALVRLENTEVIVKAVRIIQFLFFALLIVYLILLHNANPSSILLPFLLPLPPAFVIVVALLGGWLMGWLPNRLLLWRRKREIRKLSRRVAELEQHVPTYDKNTQSRRTPVIPDRHHGRSGGKTPGKNA